MNFYLAYNATKQENVWSLEWCAEKGVNQTLVDLVSDIQKSDTMAGKKWNAAVNKIVGVDEWPDPSDPTCWKGLRVDMVSSSFAFDETIDVSTKKNSIVLIPNNLSALLPILKKAVSQFPNTTDLYLCVSVHEIKRNILSDEGKKKIVHKHYHAVTIGDKDLWIEKMSKRLLELAKADEDNHDSFVPDVTRISMSPCRKHFVCWGCPKPHYKDKAHRTMDGSFSGKGKNSFVPGFAAVYTHLMSCHAAEDRMKSKGPFKDFFKKEGGGGGYGGGKVDRDIAEKGGNGEPKGEKDSNVDESNEKNNSAAKVEAEVQEGRIADEGTGKHGEGQQSKVEVGRKRGADDALELSEGDGSESDVVVVNKAERPVGSQDLPPVVKEMMKGFIP